MLELGFMREIGQSAGVTVDLVVPVRNESAVLAASVRRLRGHFAEGAWPWSLVITIVDNGSTDGTAAVAVSLASELPGVRCLQLPRPGRGLALREAWLASSAEILAYTDVDLSTGLDALAPMVASLLSGHSEVAIGSRLAPGSSVARGTRREVVSRAYNVILRLATGASFTDAQCGFKAIRADVARLLVPLVEDDAWFFDTELLLLAEHDGMRIHEVAVDWVDDAESSVRLVPTAVADMKGVIRVLRCFARGGGIVPDGTFVRAAPPDVRLSGFAGVGVISTATYLGLFLAARPIGVLAANAAALAAASAVNALAHSEVTFVGRRASGVLSLGVSLFVAGVAISSGALLAADAVSGGIAAELVAMVAASSVVSTIRFVALRARALRTR